jgi:hypothetical protein
MRAPVTITEAATSVSNVGAPMIDILNLSATMSLVLSGGGDD